jgi:hypothetical protein
LRRYYSRFPSEQIMVILFDDLIASPQQVLRAIFRFLGVDSEFFADTSIRHNTGVAPRSNVLNRFADSGLSLVRPFTPQWLRSRGLSIKLRRPILRKPEPLAPQLRHQLTEQYRGDIIATGELIGRDLSHWLS